LQLSEEYVKNVRSYDQITPAAVSQPFLYLSNYSLSDLFLPFSLPLQVMEGV
jgi:hypothetical protein